MRFPPIWCRLCELSTPYSSMVRMRNAVPKAVTYSRLVLAPMVKIVMTAQMIAVAT